MAVADFDVFIELLRIARYALDRKHEEENYKRRDSEIINIPTKNSNENSDNNRVPDSPSRRRRKVQGSSPSRRRRSPSKGNVSSLHSTI